MSEMINLVDTKGTRIGEIEKLEAHRKALLHEAFSIFVLDDAGRLLLQQRAMTKYHSAGLWTNTCCSHPRVGEEIESAVHRRLFEEMGFDCPLHEVGAFVYRTDALEDGLVEHEFDHIFVGMIRGDVAIMPNLEEVEAYRWRALSEVHNDVRLYPERYTEWFKIILRESAARYPELSSN